MMHARKNGICGMIHAHEVCSLSTCLLLLQKNYDNDSTAVHALRFEINECVAGGQPRPIAVCSCQQGPEKATGEPYRSPRPWRSVCNMRIGGKFLGSVDQRPPQDFSSRSCLRPAPPHNFVINPTEVPNKYTQNTRGFFFLS